MEKRKKRLEKSGRKLIKQKVIPEYQKFYDFFTNEYMANCRSKVGITELEDGEAYYQYLIE